MDFGNLDQDKSNVEDRRGLGGSGLKLGIGGTILLLIGSVIFKTDLFSLIGQTDSPTQTTGAARPDPDTTQRGQAERGLEQVAVGTFNDAQSFWSRSLTSSSAAYRNAKLALFWDQTRSGCGAAGAEMGPFYCPADEHVYIDLGFYRELASRFGAPGGFAQAYVIAHEMGHHIQKLLGISDKVQSQMRGDPAHRNAASVRLELQADCLAGVWGHSAAQRKLLDAGDVEAGLRAASAVGDDRLQKMAGRHVSPESFTHGSAADRSRWFKEGLEKGSVQACNTFAEK